jgi:hypothetical protein
MSGRASPWLVLLAISSTHMHARAEDDDGPAPVNTSQSLSAGADEDFSTTRSGANAERGPQHTAGTYMGVVPGAASRPPAASVAAKAPLTITWPGFQMRADGSSRVFIQSNAPLAPQPTAAPGRFLVHLPGAHIIAGTNRLPLETRYFNTPVTKVSLSTDRSGVTLVLELRADVAPQLSTETGAAGYYFTFIELPKGNYVQTIEPSKIAAAAPPEPSAARHISARTRRMRRPDDLTTTLDTSDSARAAPDTPSGQPDGQSGANLKLHN